MYDISKLTSQYCRLHKSAIDKFLTDNLREPTEQEERKISHDAMNLTFKFQVSYPYREAVRKQVLAEIKKREEQKILRQREEERVLALEYLRQRDLSQETSCAQQEYEPDKVLYSDKHWDH